MGRAALTASLLGTAFVAAIAATTPSYALEAKQCLPMAEMNAALKAEGQRSLIIGDRFAIQNPTNQVKDMRVDKWMNAVTSNEDGSLGYQIEGDLPRAQSSTKVCVAAKLTNIDLLDARRASSPPPRALLGGKFDRVVVELGAKGTRPMLVADTLHRNLDGTERHGLPLVMFGNVAGRSGSLTTLKADGSVVDLAFLKDTDYTPAAIQKLDAKPQVLALRTPN
jgi:hypothetical protein